MTSDGFIVVMSRLYERIQSWYSNQAYRYEGITVGYINIEAIACTIHVMQVKNCNLEQREGKKRITKQKKFVEFFLRFYGQSVVFSMKLTAWCPSTHTFIYVKSGDMSLLCSVTFWQNSSPHSSFMEFADDVTLGVLSKYAGGIFVINLLQLSSIILTFYIAWDSEGLTQICLMCHEIAQKFLSDHQSIKSQSLTVT